MIQGRRNGVGGLRPVQVEDRMMKRDGGGEMRLVMPSRCARAQTVCVERYRGLPESIASTNNDDANNFLFPSSRDLFFFFHVFATFKDHSFY